MADRILLVIISYLLSVHTWMKRTPEEAPIPLTIFDPTAKLSNPAATDINTKNNNGGGARLVCC